MAQTRPMNGYIKLASLMGPHPELAIYRRFSTLNAHNLLFLQAELVFLENKLQKYIEADNASGHIDRSIYDRDWQSLSESESMPDGCPKQWETARQIRKTLKEYNETLLVQRLVAKAESPLARDLTFLQQWMKRPTMGYVYLLGADGDAYAESDLSELVSIKSHGNVLATRIIGDFAVRFWHRFLGRKKKSRANGTYANTIHYSDETLLKVGGVTGTMCASMLPVLAVVVLYYVQSMERRLAVIGLFTSLFSAVLGMFSNSRRIEIFAATAGFAAVQVVFVGTTSGTINDILEPLGC